MEGHRRREKDQIWESLRADIERMFIGERLGLNEIIAWLAKKDIHVTKNKLNYRLNRIWRLRTRAPRGQAKQLWRVAKQAQESKQEEEQDQSGTRIGSIILPNHQRLKARDPARQIKRYNTETHHVGMYVHLVISMARSAEVYYPSLDSSERRRAACFNSISNTGTGSNVHPMAQRLALVGLQYTATQEADTQLPRNTSRARLMELFGMPAGILAMNERLNHLFISKLASQIPEVEYGDASRRAQLVLSDRSEKALSEQMKLLLGRISNNLFDARMGLDEFEFLLGLIERSGLSKTPLDIQGHDYTTKAVSDVLFQRAFGFLIQIESPRVKIQYDATRACRVLIWLLKSRQDPNILIPFYVGRRKTTGLQISLALGLSDLAIALLDHGANPGGLKGQILSPEYVPEELFNLHPIFLSFVTRQQTVTARLESSGESLLGEIGLLPFDFALQDSRFGVMDRDNRAGASLGNPTPLAFIFLRLQESCTASIVQYLFERTNSNGTPMYRSLVDWRELLIYASSAGNLSVLKLILSRQSDILKFRPSTMADFANWPNTWGITPLHAAALAKRNSVEACKLLHEHGAIFGSDSELLHLACYFGTIDTVIYLHQRGAMINNRCSRCSPFWRSSGLPQLNPLQCTPLEFIFQRCEDWKYYSFEDGAAICAYLIRKGAGVPLGLVEFAIRTCSIELMSLALDTAVEIVDLYQQTYGSPLSRVLMPLDTSLYPKRHTEEQTRDRVLMSHRLLNYGARVEAGHAAMAAYHGDWALVKRIVDTDTDGVSKTFPYFPYDNDLFSFRLSDYPIGISLLETAILSGSQDVAKKAFELDPDQYSAGALCAATMMGSITGDFTIVGDLLKNRSRLESQVSKQQRCREMSAVGIAAWNGKWELLQLLKEQLSWSDKAFIPDNEETWEVLKKNPYIKPSGPIGSRNWTSGQPDFIRFWNEGRIGSIQLFAIKTEARIFDLFFNATSTITPSTLEMMFMLDCHDRIPAVLRHANRTQLIHSCEEDSTPLGSAIVFADISLVRLLLDFGCEVNRLNEVHWACDGITSPLTVAILEDKMEVANLLLDKHADVDIPTTSGNVAYTPLQAACQTGQIGMVMKLMMLGANPNLPSSSRFSNSPLKLAAEYGRLDIVHLLLANEVKKVETKGPGRWYYIEAVRIASKECHIQVEKLLRSHRVWTEEDWDLWNNPRRLENDGDSAGGPDVHSDDGSDVDSENGWDLDSCGEPVYVSRSEDGELEPGPLQTDIPSNVISQSNEADPGRNDPVDEPITFDGTLEDPTFTADPFVGYQHMDDMLNEDFRLEWDNLDFI
ncbi:Ent-kaur-16-ene synthase [Apiospora arundinis]